MNIELFIHGKPSEGELLCTQQFNGFEERIYKEYFESDSKPMVSPCFVYEIRRWKDILYSVYSLYNNGNDSVGRENGYCVITLVVQEFVTTDYNAINKILSTVYQSLISNNIIDRFGNYQIRVFDGNIDLSSFQNTAESLLKNIKFQELTGISFGKPAPTPFCINSKDATEFAILSGLKKQGRVYVSTKYKSSEQLETERIMRQTQQEKIVKKPKMKDPTVIGEKNQIEKYDAKTLEDLSKKIDLLLQRVPADKAGGFPFSNSAAEEPDTNNVKNFFKGVSIFNWVTVVNCVLLLLCLFRCNPNPRNNTDRDYTSVTINDSTDVTKDVPLKFTQEDFSSLQRKNGELKQVISVLENYPEISIDIEGLSEDKIKLGESYKLTLTHDDQVVPISIGTLKCSSGLTIGKDEAGNYSITGIESGPQTISCYIGDYLLVDRKINVVHQ